MNTSMTINATAAWLWALYLALADERGVDAATLSGTTQNDIVKEYLSRGTYIYAPEPSKRLIVDMIAYGIDHVPRGTRSTSAATTSKRPAPPPSRRSPTRSRRRSTCSTRCAPRGRSPQSRCPGSPDASLLRQRGGALHRGDRQDARVRRDVGRDLPRALRREDPSLRRFRYGVQVDSLGLTEQQPENNVQRIVLEMLGVTLSADTRARAIQLPAWNEALGLPGPGTSSGACGSSRSSPTRGTCSSTPTSSPARRSWRRRWRDRSRRARAELDDVLEPRRRVRRHRGAEGRLVASQAERVARIESGEQIVVGVNRFTETRRRR